MDTVILRFRDLVTAPNDTVRLHVEIINENGRGFVWWGWWSKAGEQIPDDAFREIRDLAVADGGLRVYLMDSGTGRVYQATCTDLRWDAYHNRMPSPDVNATPTYYRDQQYFAWFRFTGIDLVDEGVLHDFTYERVDAFFDGGESRYTAFYDKRVYSVRELRQQDRTIWFVRRAVAADPTHEVSLLDPKQITPSDFPATFIQSSSRTLLWISDPHLTADGHHGFPLVSDVAQSDLALTIERACRARGIESTAGVLISGDLTWRADPGEYRLARDFVSRLNSWAKLDNYGYAICPGNHDVRFTDDSPAEKDTAVTRAGPATTAAYSDFYRGLFYKAPNEFLSSGRRFFLGGTIVVEVVFLNSSLLSQAAGHFQGHGFVGEEQLTHAASQFGWDRPSEERAIRLLVVHHHLLPVTYRELPLSGRMYSIALDAEAIMRWIVRCKVDVVLHGHMHQPFFARVVRPETPVAGGEHAFTVIGAGSAGVSAGHLGEVQRNTFCTLTFKSNELTATTYAIHPVNPVAELWSVSAHLKSTP